MKNVNMWGSLLITILFVVGCSTTKNKNTSQDHHYSESDLEKLDEKAINEGKVVIVKYINLKDISLVGNSSAWASAPRTVVDLTSQRFVIPHGGGSTRTVTAQALHNRKQVAFKVTWDDVSVNLENGVDTFRDSVAVAFPTSLGEDEPNPYMGDEDNPINIWQWRSDWQGDKDGTRNLSKRQPVADGVYQYNLDKLYTHKYFPHRVKTAPIIEYIAAGYGSLTKQKHQNVFGNGVYKNGKWSVVFLRKLKRNEKGDAIFIPGKSTLINFAVWDGNENEVNGKKSVSLAWLKLSFDKK